jgi:hypothetical protein
MPSPDAALSRSYPPKNACKPWIVMGAKTLNLPYPGKTCKSLIFMASKTLDFPSPTCGRGCPAGAGEGALAGKSTFSLTLSHQWEREQTQVCSVLFAGQKSVACRATGAPPICGRGRPDGAGEGGLGAQKYPLPSPLPQLGAGKNLSGSRLRLLSTGFC